MTLLAPSVPCLAAQPRRRSAPGTGAMCWSGLDRVCVISASCPLLLGLLCWSGVGPATWGTEERVAVLRWRRERWGVRDGSSQTVHCSLCCGYSGCC